jgi:hypothetical protein
MEEFADTHSSPLLVLQAADDYGISELKYLVEQHLAKAINVFTQPGTLLALYEAAQRCQASHLRTEALCFLAKSADSNKTYDTLKQYCTSAGGQIFLDFLATLDTIRDANFGLLPVAMATRREELFDFLTFEKPLEEANAKLREYHWVELNSLKALHFACTQYCEHSTDSESPRNKACLSKIRTILARGVLM